MAYSKINLPARYHRVHVVLHWLMAFMIIFVPLYHQFIIKGNLITRVWFEVR